MKKWKPPKNPKALNIGFQDFHMQRSFPTFQLIKDDYIYWIGELQPTPTSENYKIKVVYHPYRPKVFVLEPEILSFAPHRYGDQSLCLYYPNDKSFDGESIIAHTLIPWTSEWLYFYEAWLEEGVWWGKEAPHSPS
ncbi:hypothetical protein [Fictibacillus barbaricus]|uniref:Type II CBASS E2 protein domain-containing protein n=1 Tax=Fictibacillus barbaricus TaxID=182136 RepID=A0ABS2ZII7_9BACL|nr:hypothetical protein [Fictibacillus barbaricus]MBN3547988.1 hypothetical protein [Fictibacillus barbaricus]GGB53125.1 hypothetical protein GCM10007199_18730 [Fictibacillus barbaricus]